LSEDQTNFIRMRSPDAELRYSVFRFDTYALPMLLRLPRLNDIKHTTWSWTLHVTCHENTMKDLLFMQIW